MLLKWLKSFGREETGEICSRTSSLKSIRELGEFSLSIQDYHIIQFSPSPAMAITG